MSINKFTVKNIIAIVVLVGAIGYGGYEFYITNENLKNVNLDLAEAKKEILELKKSSSEQIKNLQQDVDRLNRDNILLSEALQNEKDKVASQQETIEDISEQLTNYEKLQELDPEILKKYSKVYFLSEHYVPSSLTLIPKKYLYYEEDPEQIHKEVYPYLRNMIEQAEGDGIDLFVRSGYRSYGTQSDLKNQYVINYGSGTANDFSAEQGYSEHQLGTTVDFLTTGINGTVDGFGETEAYQWLLDNAYKYGFVLSYPQDNGYYIFEPWHWRFVGQDLAVYLHRNNINFYDMDQREIDEYLITIFE